MFCIKYSLFNPAVPYDDHICQIKRFEIHRLPLVSVQILANALAEATPTPIAHEELQERGLEHASSPPLL
jgi:hypothetical protein